MFAYINILGREGGARAIKQPEEDGPMIQSLIVFSHLRWDFVFQRPQQLMQRLARDWQIYFFEEPMRSDRSYLERTSPLPGVTVCRPYTPVDAQGFHDDQIPILQGLVESLAASDLGEAYGAWFYSPMALPLMKALDPAVVVYDCMDELSAFRNPPRQIRQRESALLKRADVVFTGGPSLYESKRPHHPNVHCFPSSVDAKHFERAMAPGADHPLQGHLERPRIGFFGVIDERIDLELLDRTAAMRTGWQFVMVGPVAKIAESTLPRRANIHYFGQQPYAELPEFVGGWDVCMQPFMLNDSTRFISPTKTLEYMATGRPIVSTPIADVVGPYSEIVQVAATAAEFTAACERTLRETAFEQELRMRATQAVMARTSWDRTADAMKAHVDSATTTVDVPTAGERLPPAPRVVAETTRPERRTRERLREYQTIVIGAGPTGLSAGFHLGKDCLLLEQNQRVGGGCRSIQDSGFTFDYAGHIMFSNDPYVHSLYDKLLGDNVHWQDREAWIYSKRTYTRYPFQGALYGLPPDVLKDCLMGAIEARFGVLVPAANTDDGRHCKAESITDCCGDGVLESTLPSSKAAIVAGNRSTARVSENFEQFIYRVWGKGIAKHFAIPYNSKLWAVPLAEMETSWLGGRVPLPDLEDMIDGALRSVPRPQGPNARFGYPLRGGFQALIDGFLPLLDCDLLTNARVTQVDPVRRTVSLDDGRQFRYRQLVNTAPLPVLGGLLGKALPERLKKACAELRHVSVRCVNLGIARPDVTDKHWIYYPENAVFHRIFVQGNASPHCNPPGGFGLTCEITYSEHKPLPCDGEALIDRCIADCIDVGLLRSDDHILARNQADIPYAYVVYDHARARNVAAVREWLLGLDITLAGRYAEWEYYNSDHAFLAGKRAAEHVRAVLEGASREIQTSA